MSVPEEAVAAGVQAALSLYPDGHLDRDPLERDVRAVLEAAAPTIAAASIASHEHTWVRCEKCLSDGPCPCSGGICCPGEQREIEERAEGAAAERERTREAIRRTEQAAAACQAKAIEHAVAAERERIRQLAEQHRAVYDETKPCSCGRTRPDGSPCVVMLRRDVPFADLLADPVPAIPAEGTTS